MINPLQQAQVVVLTNRVKLLEDNITTLINQLNYLANQNHSSYQELAFFGTNTIDYYHGNGICNYKILNIQTREVVLPARVVLNYGHIYVQMPITSDYYLVLF